MSFVIRPATVEDVPTILKFIMELAVYEKLAHEVVATEEILKSTLFGPKQYPLPLFLSHSFSPSHFTPPFPLSSPLFLSPSSLPFRLSLFKLLHYQPTTQQTKQKNKKNKKKTKKVN
jgi:hypothetical protein